MLIRIPFSTTFPDPILPVSYEQLRAWSNDHLDEVTMREIMRGFNTVQANAESRRIQGVSLIVSTPREVSRASQLVEFFGHATVGAAVGHASPRHVPFMDISSVQRPVDRVAYQPPATLPAAG